jgi:hypothetical protein
MSRARNPYRRAGAWIAGTSWTSPAPAKPEEQPTPPVAPPVDELRHGYTLADIGGIARQAVDRCRAQVLDQSDRYDLAWSGIVEHLYAAETAPERVDLILAGQRAIWDEIDDRTRDAGYRVGQLDSGPGEAPGWRKYWTMHAAIVQSHEDSVVERIALQQILPRVRPLHRSTIIALAAHGSYQAAADGLDMPKGRLICYLASGRQRFRHWWHQGETPSGHWGNDQRASSDNSGGQAKADIREQLKHRRHRERVKRIAAGLEDARPKREPITADAIAAIAAMYREGLTIRQCIAESGETEMRVRDALKAAGVQMRPRGRPRRTEGDAS